MLTLEYEHTKEETNERNTHTRTYNNFYKYKCKKVGGTNHQKYTYSTYNNNRLDKTWSANMSKT